MPPGKNFCKYDDTWFIFQEQAQMLLLPFPNSSVPSIVAFGARLKKTQILCNNIVMSGSLLEAKKEKEKKRDFYLSRDAVS